MHPTPAAPEAHQGSAPPSVPLAWQGFAPHWDDIDAYVLQLEGKKRWRVYGPREEVHVLPRWAPQHENCWVT